MFPPRSFPQASYQPYLTYYFGHFIKAHSHFSALVYHPFHYIVPLFSLIASSILILLILFLLILPSADPHYHYVLAFLLPSLLDSLKLYLIFYHHFYYLFYLQLYHLTLQLVMTFSTLIICLPLLSCFSIEFIQYPLDHPDSHWPIQSSLLYPLQFFHPTLSQFGYYWSLRYLSWFIRYRLQIHNLLLLCSRF